VNGNRPRPGTVDKPTERGLGHQILRTACSRRCRYAARACGMRSPQCDGQAAANGMPCALRTGKDHGRRFPCWASADRLDATRRPGSSTAQQHPARIAGKAWSATRHGGSMRDTVDPRQRMSGVRWEGREVCRRNTSGPRRIDIADAGPGHARAVRARGNPRSDPGSVCVARNIAQVFSKTSMRPKSESDRLRHMLEAALCRSLPRAARRRRTHHIEKSTTGNLFSRTARKAG